jgi:uncharacterized membrane protein YfcA
VPAFDVLLAAAAVAAFVVGFLRTSLGAGIGLVLTPTLSLVLPAPMVLALITPMMNLSDPLALRYYWRRWDVRQLWVLMPAALVGVALGTWALSLLSEFWLRKVIGALALVFGLLQLVLIVRRTVLFGAAPPRAVGIAAGMVSGVSSAVSHSGGVILSLYLVNAGLSTTAILGTGSAVVTCANALKFLGYWRIGFLTPEILLAALLSLPWLALGAWLGYRVNRVLPRRGFELAIVAIALAGSLKLLAG